jgi:RNA polymerase sigma factor (sigma-70 family)
VRRTPPPFEEFLERHRSTVYRFLLVSVGPSDVDDVFQETFISALRAYARVRDDGRLDRWILRIASRKAIDHHRGSNRRPVPVESVPERPIEVDHAERDAPLWGAVRSLPPKQRTAVVLRHVLDRQYDEIADVLACSEEAARANVSQGTKRLRELMR